METLAKVLSALKQGQIIEYAKNDKKYTLGGEEIDKETIDELFENYNLATYMVLKDRLIYTLNPRYCYIYNCGTWCKANTYVEEGEMKFSKEQIKLMKVLIESEIRITELSMNKNIKENLSANLHIKKLKQLNAIRNKLLKGLK